MGLKPLHDWVLIKRDEPEEKTASGIIIPNTAKGKPSQGTVEAIGPGTYKKEQGKKEERFVPTVLKPGQHVFFIDYAARDVDLNGEKITLIREEDILGTFEGSTGVTVREPSRGESMRKHQPMAKEEVVKEVKKAPEKEITSRAKKTIKQGKTGAAKKMKKRTAKKTESVKKKSTKATKKKRQVKTKAKVEARTKVKTRETTTKKKASPKKTGTKKAVQKKTGPKTKSRTRK
jgi:chaperonin GroES